MTQSKESQRTIQYLRDILPRLNHPVRFSLVHNDYAFHNILIKQVSGHWEVSGILDFEWSFYGDGDWDIACFYWYLRDRGYNNFNYTFNVFKSAYYRNYIGPTIPTLDKIKAYTLLRLLFLHAKYPVHFDEDDFGMVMRWKQGRIKAK